MHAPNPLILFRHLLAGALTAALVVGPLSGCQLFGLDDREFEINLPPIPIGPVQFRGSLMRLSQCPPPEALEELDGESINIDIVQGLATNLLDPEGGAAEIQQYADRINGVTISKITYKIGLNTLDKNLDSIDILFGAFRDDFDPTNIDLTVELEEYGAAVYGSTNTIEGGTTTTEQGPKENRGFVPVLQNASGQAKVRQFLSSFQFTTLFGTTLDLTPQDCLDLGGDLEIEARISIVLFVEPI